MDLTKPSGLSREDASQFQDEAVVRAYHHRMPYPPEMFELLAELAGVTRPRVLDLGCGSGDLTLGVSEFAAAVDGIDFSEAMIAQARIRGRERDNVRWICGSVETAHISGPYDLVTAGQSLHWMDWPVVFARLRLLLKPGAWLAIVERDYVNKEWWDDAFQALIARYSTNRNYRPCDLIKAPARGRPVPLWLSRAWAAILGRCACRLPRPRCSMLAPGPTFSGGPIARWANYTRSSRIL
jgi:SAM-dependent methyltransferase